MSLRLLAIWMSALCAGSAIAIGLFGTRGVSSTIDPPVPVMQTPEPPSPTVTPLPPPPVPPPDAAGISHTTPPFEVMSPKPQPTVPGSLWLTAGETSVVPIAMHGGRPFVPVVVDGVRHDFLLSSLQASAIDESLPVDGAAGAYFLQTVQIGDVRLTHVKVSRARLGPFSQTYLGAKAAGILGVELFARFPVALDYANRTLTIYRSESAAAAARPTNATVVPMEMVNGMPAVACAFDGANASPCFIEIYSDADLSLSRGWKHVSGTAMLMRDAEPGRELRGVLTRAHNVSIGTTQVASPIVEFVDDEHGDVAAPSFRPQLGSGIFSRFAITIDELGGTFVISGSPTAASTASPIDGSGLWLVWRNNAIAVRSVVRKSPADVAGLISGDVVLALDGKAAQDLDAARESLARPTGTSVTLTIARGTARRDVVLTLRSLI